MRWPVRLPYSAFVGGRWAAADLKKGTASVGVQRQYTGTAGRIENAQVAVYLVYSTPVGHAAIDRRLYIPRSWTQDPDRCRAAGIPDSTGFATKPALATEMIAQALDAGVTAAWVTGDEVYGGDPYLSAELECRQIGYVLAVSRRRLIPTRAGAFTAGMPAHCLPKKAWQRLSAGDGAKGHRFYDWAQVEIVSPSGSTGHRSLLIRRSRRAGELAFHRCYSAGLVPLSTLVKVAGRRWTVEETFQSAKGLTGLDEHQVRRWTSWHRWTTLAMLAHAFLVVTAAIERTAATTPGLAPLTCGEIQRLFAAFCAPHPRSLAHRLSWSLAPTTSGPCAQQPLPAPCPPTVTFPVTALAFPIANLERRGCEGARMGVMGVWVVGVVADNPIEEARRRFPDAAGAHGAWSASSADMIPWCEPLEPAELLDGTPERSSRIDEIVRFADAVYRVRNDETEVEEFQDYLLHAVPQQESAGMFCAAVPRGDGAAALMWGLGRDTTLRFPGCCGQFLFDAAQVRAALPAAEQVLVLHPLRRAHVATRIRLWLDEMADDPNCNIDELIDGPLRVLRYAARTGVGAVGLTLWY